MIPDSVETRLNRLETGMAGLKERVDTSLMYVTRDISGVNTSLDEVRRSIRELGAAAERRDKEMRALMEEQRDREDKREKEEEKRSKADRDTRRMQLFQLISTIVVVIGLLITIVTVLQGSGP